MTSRTNTNAVESGQVWARTKGPGHLVRVMAVVEGYVMYRIPEGFPLVHGIIDFIHHFNRVKK